MGTPVDSRVFNFTAPHKLEIVSQPCRAPGAGEVRHKTLCSLVSIGTEMICYARNVEPGSHWDNWIQYPFEPGYLVVGEVTDVGEGVKDFAAGDLVFSVDAHKSHHTEPVSMLTPVPKGLKPEFAVWAHLNVIVQNGIRATQPVLGETAAVVGLGPLGQLAVRLLSLAGMRHVVAIDPVANRCELARTGGATHAWSKPLGECIDAMKELTKGRGADIVYDITGNPEVFRLAQQMCAKKGRLGLIGDVPFPAKQTLTPDVITKGLSIVASHGGMPPWDGNMFYRWGKRDMSDLFFDFILQGRLSMEGMVSHRIKPADAPAVYEDIFANRGRYMGVVIDWTK